MNPLFLIPIGIFSFLAGGVQVPTATNVNVADQATSVGLPTNVYV